MLNRWWIVCGACVLFACGGSGGGGGGGGSGSATGTVGSVSFSSVAEAVSVAISGPVCVNGSPSGTLSSELVIVLSDVAGHCGSASSGGAAPAGTELIIVVAASGSSQPAAIAAGTYGATAGANPAAGAFLLKLDGNGCANGTTSYSASGSVTLTAVSDSGATGTYNFSFVDSSTGAANGSLSGSFTSSNCGPPVSNTSCASSTGHTSC
jgi:hypothetical protein